MKPQELFDYANAYAIKRGKSGVFGSEWPTFQQAAKHFKCSLEDVQDAIDDWSGKGYLGASMGGICNGGIFTTVDMAEYRIEAYH